ncbi:MAG: YndJ family transporter [Candidatus Dormibacteraceae bacterium]
MVDLLLLLAPVVLVPLGFCLAPLTRPHAILLLRIARYVQPVGALGAIASFLAPIGWQAGLLATAWLAVCVIASVAGLVELVEVRSLHPIYLLPAAALGVLSVAAAWLVAARSGNDFGYSPTIAELTAVHLHYAGFAAVMMSALVLNALTTASLRMRRLAAGAGLLVLFGTSITASGVATGISLPTVIGPVLLATGILTTSALTAFVIAPGMPARARWPLTLSAAGVVIPMFLGVDYAAARVFPIPALDLRTMVLVHGDLNATVFARLGFVGWMLA